MNKFIIIVVIAILFLAVSIIKNRHQSSFQPQTTGQDISKINTAGTEDLPTISPDGKKLYIAYSPLDIHYLVNNMRRGKSLKASIRIIGPMRYPHTKEKIYDHLLYYNYVATRQDDGTWSEPEYINFQEEEKYFFGLRDISYDGKTALLYGGSSGPDNIGSGDIYISHNIGGSWTLPKNLGRPVNTELLEDDGVLSSDSKTIYFNVDKPGGYGKFDIYTTTKNNNGNWSKPVNLGPNINNELVQKAPFINKEGNRLYFNSETPNLKNKMNIFVSEKVNGEWQKPKMIDIGVDRFAVGNPSVTEDEKILYYYAITPYNVSESGITEWDVYYSTKQPDESWSKGVLVD